MQAMRGGSFQIKYPSPPHLMHCTNLACRIKYPRKDQRPSKWRARTVAIYSKEGPPEMGSGEKKEEEIKERERGIKKCVTKKCITQRIFAFLSIILYLNYCLTLFPFFKSPRKAIETWRVGLDNPPLQINYIGLPFLPIPI